MNRTGLTRRLPGFRFETQAGVPADILPRMDIAAMAGFAGRGPVHLPVAVESPEQYAMIFGGDLGLASTAAGESLRANLGPAVQDFFRHGGRRCWIIRIAGDGAVTTRFPLPGVVQVSGSSLQQAFAQARSPGSGFDALRIATSLVSQSLEVVTPPSPTRLAAVLMEDKQRDLVPGDTLRFTHRSEGYEALGVAASVLPVSISPPLRRQVREVQFSALHWFGWPATRRPSSAAVTLFHDIGSGTSRQWSGSLVPTPSSPAGVEWPTRLEDREVELLATIPSSELPPVGALLRISLDGGTLLFRVDSIAGSEDAGSPPSASARLSGEARWLLTAPPAASSTPTAECLTFDLWTRSPGESVLRLEELGLGAAHPRCWNELPSDALLLEEPNLTDAVRAAGAESFEALWKDAADPRFPVAGGAVRDADFLPVLMRPLADQWIAPVAESEAALVRDGLQEFGAALFLDPGLLGMTTGGLAGAAEFVRYQATEPRRLRGIHAVFGLDEVTLLAVPDAIHPGWSPSVAEELPAVQPPPNPESPAGSFRNCSLHLPSAPVLRLESGPDLAGTFRLGWVHTDPGATAIELREGTLPDLSSAVAIHIGPGSERTLYGRTPGFYHYVARSIANGIPGDWSPVLSVSVSRAGRWQVEDWSDAGRDQLLALHREILRLSTARGDMFAVLALPAGWQAESALEHLASLRTGGGSAVDVGDGFSLPLGDAESGAFTQGALYHPWPVRRDPEGALRRVPPDGAMAGLIADRSLKRGAWIAPANDALQDLVALEPALPAEAWQSLQDAQLNFLRQDPGGFRCLAADTLSSDPELHPINVRRLLHLLRRAALRLGATYVFEPMNDAFIRTVHHAFENLMLHLFARGALAGRSPADSFQVNTGPSVNPPESRELGRFIVEIKVAPALPLRFLTLRLVQTGDRATVSETQ